MTLAVVALRAAPPAWPHLTQALTIQEMLQVQLYIGNLSSEWQEDLPFVTAMSAYGTLERCFVMRNAQGESKVGLLSAGV